MRSASRDDRGRLALADVNTGGAGTLRLEVGEASYNSAENYSDVAWNLWLIERTSSPATNSGGTDASVRFEEGYWWVGSFSFSWAAGGLQNVLIASGTNRVYHNADGKRSINVIGRMEATGTSGAGGPTEVTQPITLTDLTLVPSTPSGVTATRISDTQTTLSWGNSGGRATPTNIAVDIRYNGGPWGRIVNMGNATSVTVGAYANNKIEYRVSAGNSAGYSGWGQSNAIYTTPGAPTNVTAVKNAGLDIVIGFTENVDFAEHTHEVWHGTVSGGVTTWDIAALATLASGVTSYTHVAPNASVVHIYRVRAQAGSLSSAYATSGAVQLLVAPNKPTVPAMPAAADKASALTFAWTHNPADTTPQTAYEFSYSTNGGSSWTSTGKVTSTAQSRAITASTYAANVALTTRVRTWGQATTGGADGTGASPWSDLRTVTYKTVPTTSITAPVNGSSISDSTVRVNVTFAQAESATFVKAQVQLLQGATLLEEKDSTIQVGITLDTAVQNAGSYTVRARVQDSNGLWSAWASNTFSVAFLAPVPAVATASFLPESGFAQLNLLIAAPGAGQAAAVSVTITRTINNVTETVVLDYPSADELAFLDTVPTTHGTNTYTITTKSGNGSQSSVTVVLVTEECRRAYLSKGTGFETVVVFGGNLQVKDDPSVASSTIQAAGRLKPIGLYGVETSVTLKVSSFIFENFGSEMEDIRALLLLPGKACFRDATGRRVFGSVRGSVAYKKTYRGDLNFTLTETD